MGLLRRIIARERTLLKISTHDVHLFTIFADCKTYLKKIIFFLNKKTYTHSSDKMVPFWKEKPTSSLLFLLTCVLFSTK